MRRGVLGLVTVALVGSMLAGCSTGGASSQALGRGVSVELPSGSSLSVQAKPVPMADRALISPVMLPDGVSGPSPVKALLAPVHLATSGRFPKGGVNLLF